MSHFSPTLHLNLNQVANPIDCRFEKKTKTKLEPGLFHCFYYCYHILSQIPNIYVHMCIQNPSILIPPYSQFSFLHFQLSVMNCGLRYRMENSRSKEFINCMSFWVVWWNHMSFCPFCPGSESSLCLIITLYTPPTYLVT